MNTLLFLLLCCTCSLISYSEKLDESSLACKNKTVIILTGYQIPSDFFRLDFDEMELRNELDSIVHDECKNRGGHRLRRSVLKAATQIGKRAMKKLSKLKNLYKKRKPMIKGSVKSGKAGFKGFKGGAKVATGGLKTMKGVLDFADDIYDVNDSIQQRLDKLKYEYRTNGDDSEEWSWKTRSRLSSHGMRLSNFRKEVSLLLNSNAFEGSLLRRAKQIIEESVENDSGQLEAAKVECVRDDFRNIFSIRFKIYVEEDVEATARKCDHIGKQIGENEYQFYNLPSEYLLERNGIWYQVNGSQCSHNEEGTPICLVADLEEVECFPDSADSCTQEHVNLVKGELYFRKLNVGAVYYGPANYLSLVKSSKKVNFPTEPYRLKYFRPLEGMEDCNLNNFIL